LRRVYPDEVCYDMLANGALIYASQVEIIMLKAAWLWGRDCSVVNDSLGEPGRNPLYVDFPSMWGSVDSDKMFSTFSMGGFLFGDSEKYKLMNE